jgi:hypothetical protein
VSLNPASGRAVNFSSPVTYTVAARNGTVQPYNVRVTPKPASTKEITGFSLRGVGVIETVIGSIPDSDGLIPISITVSGQANISALYPTITHTGVSIVPPGGTPLPTRFFTDSVARDFTGPQIYRIMAEDGSFKDYAVSIHASGGGAKIITGFVFKSVPVGGGKTVSVVGQINQDTLEIVVDVPHTATTLSLAPTITYLGKSVGYSDTLAGNPAQVDTNTRPAGQSDTFLDTARNFGIPRYYTVTAADPPPDNTRKYTVKVNKIPEVTVRYEAVRDDKFTTERFDQNTGLLTISITTSSIFPLSNPSYGYRDPFGWYVDGIQQPVSGTQNTLVIKTAGFPPGRHQVTVSATRSADSKHYTNLIYFDVRE